MMTPEDSIKEDIINQRLDNIQLGISTLAHWLVGKKIGFGSKDAQAIDDILVGVENPGVKIDRVSGTVVRIQVNPYTEDVFDERLGETKVVRTPEEIEAHKRFQQKTQR